MWFGIVTLFPELFSVLHYGITGRALTEKTIEVECVNPRDFAQNKYRNVDERPYGGGPGMILMAEPLRAAIQDLKKKVNEPAWVIHVSPQGKKFDQTAARELREKKNIIFVAGRYEGIDERVIDLEIDEEWSIGDYILSGGELPIMVMIDAMTRLIPGALGHEDSASNDSITSGLLKYPQYTRPDVIDELAVPPILMSGNHQAIERWRLKQSLGKTWLKRPDLLATVNLAPSERELLMEFIEEMKRKPS